MNFELPEIDIESEVREDYSNENYGDICLCGKEDCSDDKCCSYYDDRGGKIL